VRVAFSYGANDSLKAHERMQARQPGPDKRLRPTNCVRVPRVSRPRRRGVQVMDLSRVNPSTRAWCVFEWAHTLASHGPDGLHMQVRRGAVLKRLCQASQRPCCGLRWSRRTPPPPLPAPPRRRPQLAPLERAAVFRDLDVERAECFRAADKAMIMGEVWLSWRSRAAVLSWRSQGAVLSCGPCCAEIEVPGGPA
jgi:hypothetical protein